MNIEFTSSAWRDYLWFQKRDRQLLKKINQLIKETTRTPFEGTGKPEPLRVNLSGYWSRRINSEHRLVLLGRSSSTIIAEPEPVEGTAASAFDKLRRRLLLNVGELPPACTRF